MHVPFSLVLAVLMLSLSCIPAALIWTMFSQAMRSVSDTMYGTTTDSIERLSESVQDLLLRNSMRLLDARIVAGEAESVSQEAVIHAAGLLSLDIRPNETDIGSRILARMRGYNFDTVKGNPMLSYIALVGSIYDDDSPDTLGKACFWIVWQALDIDLVASRKGLPSYNRTLYLVTVELSKDEQSNNMQVWFVDQLTGTPLTLLSNVTYPWLVFSSPRLQQRSWGSDLFLNKYSGQVELAFVDNMFSGNQKMSISIGINSQTLSEELRRRLTGNVTDRLFMFFRNPNGHLIAASHGKFFRLGDVDTWDVDPLTNPPNASNFVLYTCLNSTDALIAEACRKLIATYQNWPLIPVSRQEMLLSGRPYWVAIGYSSCNLQATVVLLKDRQTVMESIDASNARVVQATDDMHRIFAVVFAVTTVVAASTPLLIGLWLGNRLQRLAYGMDRIAKMDFQHALIPQTCFHEIHNFQQSFLKMERGLRAFGQFVPSAVVTRLVAGMIHTNDKMEPENLTVMFAKIEDFSLLSGPMPPAQVAEVCSEYFEVMCKHIVKCGGTIDKFIGDCIMAMWNAPLPTPHHERSAITAALQMQAEVLELHRVWRYRKLPALRFRLGLHTGTCLVGNFGCSTRVSYTCLGDNVNLAARLEALNKRFGTTLLISQSTHAACRDGFRFRHLSKVTVAGRSEVLSVYEVICAADAATTQLKSPLLPRNSLSGPPVLEEIQAGSHLRTLHPDERIPSPPRRPEAGQFTPVCLEEAIPGANASAASCANPNVCPGISNVVCGEFLNRELSSIPYHWGWHSGQAVLKEAADYEAMYLALVKGQYASCRTLLDGRQPDPAWQQLASQLAQLEKQAAGHDPWDGVFHFREK